MTLLAVNVLLALCGSWSSTASAFRCAVGLAMTSYYAWTLFVEARFYDYLLERVRRPLNLIEIADNKPDGGVFQPLGLLPGDCRVSEDLIWVDYVVRINVDGVFFHVEGAPLFAAYPVGQRTQSIIHLHAIPIHPRQESHAARHPDPHWVHHQPHQALS